MPPHHASSPLPGPPAARSPSGWPRRGVDPDGTQWLWQKLPAGGAGGSTAPRGPIRLEDILLGEHIALTLPPRRAHRHLFQDDLLFAHLTVAENLMFGMPAHLKGWPAGGKGEARLAEVGWKSGGQAAGALSGGQKARVSLLRALLAV